MNFKINDRIEYLTKLIIEKNRRIRQAPEGLLEIKVSGRKTYYYYKRGGRKRYLRLSDSRDMQIARALAQRRYDEKVLKSAEKELRLLRQTERLYENGVVEDISEKMSSARQSLITPVRMSDEDYADQWLEQMLQMKEQKETAGQPQRIEGPQRVTFTTKNGEKVKSKSEKMIADMLLDQKKRYIYEFPVEVVDHKTGRRYTAHPDFLVLNARTRKAYFYEHFGKMDDPEYAEDNIGKMIDYRNAGIIPGENMIATFETRADPLTPESVQTMIDIFLS